nr:VWA domain-containing protein [Myxococcota bacterium]
MVALAALLLASCGARTGLGTPSSDEPFDGGLERLPDGGLRPPPRIDAAISADAMIPRDAPSIEIDGAMICGDVDLRFGMVPPTVVLLLDRSGSMRATFREPTTHFPEPASRWVVLLDLLVGPGIVDAYEDRVRFGAATYTTARACPEMTWVPPALGNADAIASELRSLGPAGGTPTGEAIEDVTDRLVELGGIEGGAPVLLLATDGEPNGCSGGDARAASVAAMRRAWDAGIRTFVTSVGDEVARSHFQDLA